MLAKILFCSAMLMLNIAPALACGVYELSGVVRFDPKSGYRIVVAEGTKSETVFAVPALQSTKLIPYKDFPVKATVSVEKPFNGTRAQVAKVESVATRVPDPLRGALDSRFELKKKQSCKKQTSKLLKQHR